MEKRPTDKQNLHILHKKLGETPFETVIKFKSEHPEYKEVPMTYAGRLDPMAEGVLLVLSGEGVMEKEKYLDLPKTYEFEVLWGVSTDTLDLLGLVQECESSHVESEQVQKYLKNSIGKFQQIYPVYSSRPVNGKSLFQWAREGRIGEIDIPKHEVEIFEAEYISRRAILKDDLLKDIQVKVSLVNGDFRQKEILEKWDEVLSQSNVIKFTIDTIKMKVSSGFYVRQFVSDLAENFGLHAVAFGIQRRKIGDYC